MAAEDLHLALQSTGDIRERSIGLKGEKPGLVANASIFPLEQMHGGIFPVGNG